MQDCPTSQLSRPEELSWFLLKFGAFCNARRRLLTSTVIKPPIKHNRIFFLPNIRQWRIVGLLFIETPIFTKLVTDLIPDDEYRKIQLALVLRPEAGKIITGIGGLRKIRWKSGSSGKRGGLRLIYFWDVAEDRIYMLLIYKKSKQEDLTPNQLKILRNLVTPIKQLGPKIAYSWRFRWR